MELAHPRMESRSHQWGPVADLSSWCYTKNMIMIQNLSPIQKEICDHLWEIESMEEVQQYIRAMPKKLRSVAESMLELMIAATFDQEINTEADCELAKEYLCRFTLN
jgi:hypothetical protein